MSQEVFQDDLADGAPELELRDHAAMFLGVHLSDTSHVQFYCQSPEQSSPFAFPEELDVHTLNVGAYVLSLNS